MELLIPEEPERRGGSRLWRDEESIRPIEARNFSPEVSDRLCEARDDRGWKEFVQRAGIAALQGGDSTLQAMRATYAKRRERMVTGLREIGFSVPVMPDGAFYVLAGARAFGESSLELAFSLLEEAGVAATPGIDFGPEAEGSLRFCYAVSDETIEEGLARMADALGGD